MRAFVFSLIFVLITAPFMVQAEEGGIIPCDGPDCSACHVVQLGNNLIVVLVQLLTLVAIIMIVIAGFRLVMSGGNSEAWESAKKSFTNIIIGIILVLSAWLIVDTIMKALVPQQRSPAISSGQGFLGVVDKGFGPWNELECPVTSSPSSSAADTARPLAGETTAPVPFTGGDAVATREAGSGSSIVSPVRNPSTFSLSTLRSDGSVRTQSFSSITECLSVESSIRNSGGSLVSSCAEEPEVDVSPSESGATDTDSNSNTDSDISLSGAVYEINCNSATGCTIQCPNDDLAVGSVMRINQTTGEQQWFRQCQVR